MNKEANFQKIYQEHYPKAMALCLGYMSGDQDEAKDMAQEVFLKVWENLENFRNQASISTWIYRITVNTCLQQLRKKNPLNLVSEVPAEADSGDGQQEKRFQEMYRCIGQLSAENRTIILLELEGLPQKEISQITGLSHEVVRTRIHRIKVQLSKCVKHE